MLKVFVLSLLISVNAWAINYQDLEYKTGALKIYSGEKFVGSGALISRNEVITAKHVCQMGNIHIYHNGSHYGIKRFKMAKKNDLCYIELKRRMKSKVFKLADGDPKINELVCGLGFPNNEFTFSCAKTKGVIRIIDSKHKVNEYLLFANYKVYFGMSGGPVINKNKELVGITVMMDICKFALFVPISTVKGFINASR